LDEKVTVIVDILAKQQRGHFMGHTVCLLQFPTRLNSLMYRQGNVFCD